MKKYIWTIAIGFLFLAGIVKADTQYFLYPFASQEIVTGTSTITKFNSWTPSTYTASTIVTTTDLYIFGKMVNPYCMYPAYSRGLIGSASSTYKYAQSFLPSTTTVLGIIANLAIVGSGQDVTLSIQDDSSGNPSGTDLVTTTILASSLHTSNPPLTFFSLPITLSDTNKKWLVFSVPLVSGTNNASISSYSANFDTGNNCYGATTYSQKTCNITSGSCVWSAVNNFDLIFGIAYKNGTSQQTLDSYSASSYSVESISTSSIISLDSYAIATSSDYIISNSSTNNMDTTSTIATASSTADILSNVKILLIIGLILTFIFLIDFTRRVIIPSKHI